MARNYGNPLNIIKFNDSKTLEFNKAELEGLLLHPSVKDRKIVVFSIVGAFRKGKSFFLDYCLRYLYGNFKSILNPNNVLDNCECWMGNPDDPLRGFSWRAGTSRETTGIIFWSDVFLHDKPNGEKLAILVVDTQGLFDNETSVADNSRIFSLSTLLSSVQILNLHGIVQEDHLQYLQFATAYAKFATNNNQQEYKPFQSFMFLLRDWGNPDEYAFGFEGGQKYLDNLLVVKPTQHEELKAVRTFIRASFDKVSCCLLPYPGKSVARESTYDGRWSLMDEDFREELKSVIPNLLKAENLVIKKINNVEMVGSVFNDFFQQYVELFRSGSSIQPLSIYEATIEKFMMAVVARSYDIYKNRVNTDKNAVVDENGIAQVFNSSKEAALANYNAEKKMGTTEHVNKYRAILEKKMETDSIEWKAVALAGIMRVRAERQRAEEAAREAERLRLKQIEDQRIAQERIAQLQREAAAREAEAARQREILHQQQLAIAAEQERQRLAEEQRQREVAEQQRIEAERAAEAERARQQHHHKRRKKCLMM